MANLLDGLYDEKDFAPHRVIYEAAHKVIRDFLDKENKKIDYVAEQLEITPSLLYKKLDPMQTQRPLSVDLATDITKITGDSRILRAMSFAAEIEDNGIQEDACAVQSMTMRIGVVLGELTKEVLESAVNNDIDDKEKKSIRKVLLDLHKTVNDLEEAVQ